MAVSDLKDIRKPEPIPQHLYTPKIEIIDTIDESKLYTPTIKNEEIIDGSLEVPDIENEKVKIPLYTPEPELFPIKIPLYTPDPENKAVRDFLIIPNPNEIDADLSIMEPDPENPIMDPSVKQPDLIGIEIDPSVVQPDPDEIIADLSIMIPDKIKNRGIPNYAYAFPIKKGAYDYLDDLWQSLRRGVNDILYEVHPLNYQYVQGRYWFEVAEGDPPYWLEKWNENWKSIQEVFVRSEREDHDFWIRIIPLKIELPPQANGKKKKIIWKIPKMRTPKRKFGREAYMSYVNEGTKFGDAKLMPDPNYKNKTLPKNQGWIFPDDWSARGEEFVDEMKDFGSFVGNGALEAVKSFGTGILGTMLGFGGYDLSKKIGGSPIKASFPHLYNFEIEDSVIQKGNIPESKSGIDGLSESFSDRRNRVSKEGFVEDNGWFTWLITSGKKKIARPSKFNYGRYNELGKGATHPMNLLWAIGPDFMKHKFDAYFVWYDEKDGTVVPLDLNNEVWMTPFQRFIFDHKGFAVRLGTINIPASSQEDFNVKWLETQVNKPRTTIVNENKATFTFRLDQNLFWLDLIDKMAAHNNTLDQTYLGAKGNREQSNKRDAPVTESNGRTNERPNGGKGSLTYGNPYFKGDNRSWKEAINYVANSFNPLYSNDKKLSLVVKMVHLSNFIHTGTQTRVLPYFIFEDIRILGTSSKVTYDRNGNAPQNISVNFIFKFLSEIYTPNEDSMYYKNSSKATYERAWNRGSADKWTGFDYLEVKLPKLDPEYRFPFITTYESNLGIEVE